MQGALIVRKLADYSAGQRISRFDPATGEKFLADPAEPDVAKPWPLLGVTIEGKPPKEAELPLSWVQRGVSEGWISLEGSSHVHRPGGPAANPWAVTHTFVQADAIVLKCVEGDVRYEVLDSPDKWPAEKDGDLGFGGEVRWFYRVRLER